MQNPLVFENALRNILLCLKNLRKFNSCHYTLPDTLVWVTARIFTLIVSVFFLKVLLHSSPLPKCTLFYYLPSYHYIPSVPPKKARLSTTNQNWAQKSTSTNQNTVSVNRETNDSSQLSRWKVFLCFGLWREVIPYLIFWRNRHAYLISTTVYY